jgi:hypothetical protein
MKNNSSRYRAIASSARLVRPKTSHDPLVLRFPPASGQSGIRARRVFVIKQVHRLPATTAVGRKIERILIFDDHPDSLRLLFGRPADSPVQLSDSQPISLSGVALLWILTAGLMMVMFWRVL